MHNHNINSQTIAWVAYKTIVRRELNRFLRLWMQTILPSAITMTLYFLIFGTFIGTRIGQMGGVSYTAFITPGLVMMTVITNAYTNTSTSFFLSKFQRNIEELLVAPVSNNVILLGYLTGGVFRGFVNGAVVITISLLFTHLHIHHVLVMSLVIILSSVMFSLAGLINAIYADDFDDISIIPTFLIAPLTYLGGVFYSVSMLSEFWQKVTYLNPILYIVEAFRYGMLGRSDTNIVYSVSVMALFTVVFYVLSWVLLRRGVGLKA